MKESPLYIDTSVLVVYTLASRVESGRFRHVEEMFNLINRGALPAVTSFYALLELFMIGLDNSTGFVQGSKQGKAALMKVLESDILLFPMVSRQDRLIHAPLFKLLKDPADVPHAICAYIMKCGAIVTYDNHFSACAGLIENLTPEEILSR